MTTLESLEIRLNQLAARVDLLIKNEDRRSDRMFDRIRKLEEYTEKSHENLGGVIDSLTATVHATEARGTPPSSKAQTCEKQPELPPSLRDHWEVCDESEAWPMGNDMVAAWMDGDRTVTRWSRDMIAYPGEHKVHPVRPRGLK